MRRDLVDLLADESAIYRLAIHDLERPTTDLQMHIGATQFVAALQQTREADIGERAHDVCIHNHSGNAPTVVALPEPLTLSAWARFGTAVVPNHAHAKRSGPNLGARRRTEWLSAQPRQANQCDRCCDRSLRG